MPIRNTAGIYFNFMAFRSINDVVRWRMCVGCGACSYLSNGSVVMREHPQLGRIPHRIREISQQCEREMLAVCPAAGASFDLGTDNPVMDSAIGPVIEVWEGHASDSEIRYQAASGGALTALSQYALERAHMSGVLHVKADPNNPIANITSLSRSRDELVSAAGSRYSPASVCDGLAMIEKASGKCLFIGQPSEVAAVRKAMEVRPVLKNKTHAILSFFCAGTPASIGTRQLLEDNGVNPEKLRNLRYRGEGWPGCLKAWNQGEDAPRLVMGYEQSWSFLQRYRPWASHLWPDPCGAHADITCGDPWHSYGSVRNEGSSLIVIRTEKGRALFHEAMKTGYIHAVRSSIDNAAQAQINLVAKKAALWGRIIAIKSLGAPTPKYLNHDMLSSWLQLKHTKKIQSILGTYRRIIARGYIRPMWNNEWQ